MCVFIISATHSATLAATDTLCHKDIRRTERGIKSKIDVAIDLASGLYYVRGDDQTTCEYQFSNT